MRAAPGKSECILSDGEFALLFSESRGLAPENRDLTNSKGNGITFREGKHAGCEGGGGSGGVWSAWEWSKN